MPHYIIKVDDKYAMWSTIVDAPRSKFYSLKEFKEWYLSSGYPEDEWDERMARVEKTTCSALDGTTAEDLISFNRAGPKEKLLSKKELLRMYS